MNESFRDRLAAGCVLFDGGMGTELYSQGVFLNKCYEELNLQRPEVVETVHRSFLQAGAEAIETNTFAANRTRLEPHGLAPQVREVNAAAARIARRAAAGRAWVAGAVGPLGIRLEPWGPTTVDEAVGLFAEQIEGLVEGGVELLVFETFTDVVEVQAAVKAARQVCDLPVVAMMTVDEAGKTPEGVPPEWMVQKLEETGAEAIGVNCSVGPAPMLSVLEAIAGVATSPLAAMPNAGIPRSVEGRMIYLTSPAYMGRYARRFRKLGARVIGGCCGVTPEHVRAMRESLRQENDRAVIPRVVVSGPSQKPRTPAPLERRSALGRKLREGRFVTAVELPPPRGWKAESVFRQAAPWIEAGIDVLLVPDDPRVSTRLSPLSLARLALDRVRDAGREGDCEAVLQYTCRDRNLLGMQADLLGAHALGLRNLLLITGQAPRPGEVSWSSTVFDVDAIGLTNVAHRLNHGLDVGDTPIGEPTSFLTGVLGTVSTPNLEEEVSRFEWKVDAGAEFGLTSAVFDVSVLERFLERIEPVRIPLLASLWVLTSLREAEYLAGEVPGVEVPPELLDRMARAAEQGREKEEGLAITRQTLEAVAGLVEGVHLCGPGSIEPEALELIRPVIGSEVRVRRSFPGRPGIRGGAESTRYPD